MLKLITQNHILRKSYTNVIITGSHDFIFKSNDFLYGSCVFLSSKIMCKIHVHYAIHNKYLLAEITLFCETALKYNNCPLYILVNG